MKTKIENVHKSNLLNSNQFFIFLFFFFFYFLSLFSFHYIFLQTFREPNNDGALSNFFHRKRIHDACFYNNTPNNFLS